LLFLENIFSQFLTDYQLLKRNRFKTFG